MATRRSRYYQRAKTIYRGKRYNKGGFGVYANGAYFAGAAASLIPVNLPPIVCDLITGIAVAPVKLPAGAKMILQGFVSGKLVQKYTGNPISGLVGGNINTGGSSSPWV